MKNSATNSKENYLVGNATGYRINEGLKKLSVQKINQMLNILNNEINELVKKDNSSALDEAVSLANYLLALKK